MYCFPFSSSISALIQNSVVCISDLDVAVHLGTKFCQEEITFSTSHRTFLYGWLLYDYAKKHWTLNTDNFQKDDFDHDFMIMTSLL